MKPATLLFGALITLLFLINTASADVPRPEDMRKIMLMNFASWCGNLGITEDWDCFPCKQPELQGFVLDGKVLNVATVMFAYMGHYEDTIWIVIRGTVPTSAVSWIINDIPIVPVPFVKSGVGSLFKKLRVPPLVAAGFLSAWKSIERPLINLMRNATNFCPHCTKVIITGHSLGAAVASFASLYASETMGIPKERITLITSGGPRTGNKAFADDVRASVGEAYRIVYGGDIVTQLPAWTGPIGYHHFPTEILVLGNGTQKVCSNTNGEDFSCANGLVFQPWRFINANHFMFGGVMGPEMYLKMIREEPPTRWCGVANSNAPGIGMFLATSDEDDDNDDPRPKAQEDQQILSLPQQGSEVEAVSVLALPQQGQQQQQQQSYEYLNAGPAFIVGLTLFVGVLAVFGFAYVISVLAKKTREN